MCGLLCNTSTVNEPHGFEMLPSVMHVTLVLFLSCLCLFPPADAFVDFVLQLHGRRHHHPGEPHAVGRRHSSYPVEGSTTAQTQEVLTNEFEGEKISTSYKIVAGLDPEWFDRFVMTPLGNTELIDGQSVEQIVQEGKSVSIEWLEQQRKRVSAAKDSGARESGTDDDTTIEQDDKRIDEDIKDDGNNSAIPNRSAESTNRTAIDSNATASTSKTPKSEFPDFQATVADPKERTEKEKKIDTNATATTLDPPEKVNKTSEKGTVMKSDASKSSMLNVEAERVETVDKGVSKAVVEKRDDDSGTTTSPEQRDEPSPVEQKEPPENTTASAAGNINTEISSGDSVGEGRVKVKKQAGASFGESVDRRDENPRGDFDSSQQITIIVSKGVETESSNQKEKAVAEKPDGLPTKSSNIASISDRSSFEHEALDQENARDAISSSTKLGDNNTRTKEKSHMVDEHKSDPKMALPLQESSVQSKPPASNIGTRPKAKTSKGTEAATNKPSTEKDTARRSREKVRERQELSQQDPVGSNTSTSLNDVPLKKENATDSSERVIVYKGLYSRPWKQVPLDKLLSLGYNEDDITALIPDTLELIAAESIKLPSSGIPARWKRKPSSQAVVKVMSSKEAKDLLNSVEPEAATKEAAGTKTKNFKSTAESDATGETEIPSRPDRSTTRRRRSDEKETRTVTSRQERREPPPTEDRRRRRRDRVSTLEDGSPKPVYSGRPSEKAIASRRRGDPPPPGAFWVDMDTFRNLLRKEAELRLRILGDGFADTVKQETMWRHDLYSDWLWTLKNGVGNPIVESRSDRYRRLREQARLEESRDIRKRRERRKRDDY
eukprot:scaffold34656_cov178-Amphora_coffeaeformis.AAC.4